MFPLSEDGAFWFTIVLFAIAAVVWARRGIWFFIQAAIVAAIVCSNIYWQWTPNPYVVCLIGIGLAYLTTVLLSGLISILLSYRNPQRLGR